MHYILVPGNFVLSATDVALWPFTNYPASENKYFLDGTSPKVMNAQLN